MCTPNNTDGPRTGFQDSYGLWKVEEIDNEVSDDLECFGKGKFSEWLWNSFGLLFGKF